MKKIVLFALPLLAMLAMSCEKDDVSPNIQFNDPAFLQALLSPGSFYTNDESWDRNGDGQISIKEAVQEGWLSIPNKSICNIDEIRYFTRIYQLNCGYNQLTSLDLSKNTALNSLSCGCNQLTLLDLSNNTKLLSLGCIGNHLTTLDLRKNTALTNLNCYNNHLTTLDLRKNTALKTLQCYNNHLTTLDLSKNTALTTLYCFNNHLTTLDLSKNTALTNLECYNNQLTKIILYRYHKLDYETIHRIESEYGDIIEYAE